MVDVIVIGGGPAGLSAGLFTSKNGLETVLFDTDESWLHNAHLFNYLGIESIDGTEFLEVGRRQVRSFGTDLRMGEAITSVQQIDGGFQVETEDDAYASEYLILATGIKRDFAEELGCEFTADELVDVSVTMETTVANAYATGAMIRDDEWQALISAGDGATAALNILSDVHGERFHDFDTPADAE